MNLTLLLSEYILALEAGAAKTARAEDRPTYQALLADAAGLLALAATDASPDDICARFEAHQRLRGNVWLVDPVFRLPAEALEKVRSAL